MFYMDLRYAGENTNEPDLVLTDNVGSIVSGNPFMGRLTTLLLWNRSDPVDEAEQGRNDLIYQRYQHNRKAISSRFSLRSRTRKNSSDSS